MPYVSTSNTPHDFTFSDSEPLDVWLRFGSADDDECEAEANTYAHNDGFVVAWSLSAVGLVRYSPLFATYGEATAWLTANDFEDFTIQ